MIITWYGKNCFKLQSGDLVIVSDPFEKENGLTPFRGRADIIIRTLTTLPLKNHSAEKIFEIAYPGEYEIKTVKIQGWPILPPKGKTEILKTVYSLKIDDLQIVFLGHLNDEKEIEEFQEFLEDADVVFVPAGGKPYLEAETAAKLIRQLKPGLAIPALFDDFKELKTFFKELGQNDIVPSEKLSVSKKDLSAEKLIIGCLKI